MAHTVAMLSPRNTGSIFSRSKRHFSTQNCPDWFWGIPSPFCNGYWVLFTL